MIRDTVTLFVFWYSKSLLLENAGIERMCAAPNELERASDYVWVWDLQDTKRNPSPISVCFKVFDQNSFESRKAQEWVNGNIFREHFERARSNRAWVSHKAKRSASNSTQHVYVCMGWWYVCVHSTHKKNLCLYACHNTGIQNPNYAVYVCVCAMRCDVIAQVCCTHMNVSPSPFLSVALSVFLSFVVFGYDHTHTPVSWEWIIFNFQAKHVSSRLEHLSSVLNWASRGVNAK